MTKPKGAQKRLEKGAIGGLVCPNPKNAGTYTDFETVAKRSVVSSIREKEKPLEFPLYDGPPQAQAPSRGRGGDRLSEQLDLSTTR